MARARAARAHFVAGLHMGKYMLDAFFRAARAVGLVIVEAPSWRRRSIRWWVATRTLVVESGMLAGGW